MPSLQKRILFLLYNVVIMKVEMIAHIMDEDREDVQKALIDLDNMDLVRLHEGTVSYSISQIGKSFLENRNYE